MADNLRAGNGGINAQIGFNFAEMNNTRPGQSPDGYDLQMIAEHEIDEVLGIGGGGSALQLDDGVAYDGQTSPTNGIRPLDLYRYSDAGVRSFSLDPGVRAYFSINGGATRLVYFNQNAGGDFGDWGNGVTLGFGNRPPQVQDAYGTPGAANDLGANELTALDIIGYTLVGRAGVQNFVFGGDTFTFDLATVPGQTYQVQSSSDLSQQSWQNLASPFVANGAAAVVMDTNATVNQKFYRLKAAQPMIVRPLRRQYPQASGGASPAIPFITMEATTRVLPRQQ